MKLIFSSIKKGTIFESDFHNLSPDYGTIEFKHMNTPGGIAVVYAPNGTGKSSLANVLGSEMTSEELSFTATQDSGRTLTPESLEFHVIPDQINRNVIRGKETDYLIGAQIRREYALRDRISSTLDNAYKNLARTYKNEYKVSKVSDYLLSQVAESARGSYQIAFSFIRSIINTHSHGDDIDPNQFISFIRDDSNRPNCIELNVEKRAWVILDASKAKIAERIINLDYHTVVANTDVIQIERHDAAIGILSKFHSLDACIVCDNHDFDGNSLLRRKTDTRNRIYDGLDQNTKDLLDKVVRDSNLISSDPFEVKRIIGEFIAGGGVEDFLQLQNDLTVHMQAIVDEMVLALFHGIDTTDFFRDYDEYNTLVETQPEFDSEELLFIQDIINESIGKAITIERDSVTKNYKLKLGDKDILENDFKNFELSSGEQNFISLAFELLMARHSTKEYVVLDDPISSFDSFYKNKIAFCIIKFLERKKQIVLTHNIDLIRLLEVQLNNCFNLYILNNVENGQNGFIPVSATEKKLLINLHDLVKLFQNKDNVLVNAIRNQRQFLMAMIPFMRGYAHIGLDPEDDYGNLSAIMHGYGTGSIDIVPIYKKFFGYDFGCVENITVDDILGIDCENLDILDKSSFPLLSNTLEQTLIYYHLRMKVEKELVDGFNIPTHDIDTLNQIIQRALGCRNTDSQYIQKRNFRVFFTSRKTLLNEFNHFEGNMNIFQPAIDINPTALRKEINDIKTKLIELRAFALCLHNHHANQL